MSFLFNIAPLVTKKLDGLVVDLNKWRDRIRDVGTVLDEIPILNGALVEGISLTGSADNVISHKLGRVPRGWIVTRAQTAVPLLYETARSDKAITLFAASSGTADIWFF